MDVAALTTAGLASSQQGSQQTMGLKAIKDTAEAEKKLASILDAAAQKQPELRSSGSIGTTINTTA